MQKMSDRLDFFSQFYISLRLTLVFHSKQAILEVAQLKDCNSSLEVFFFNLCLFVNGFILNYLIG